MRLTVGFFKVVLITLLGWGATANAFAQTDSLTRLGNKFENYRSTILQEKIFAHIDRSFYLTGETMWFRLYYTDASNHRPLNVSKVAYVEIINKENKSVTQAKIELARGEGHGSMFISASLASGNYTVRVYTSWMKNFSPELFFQRSITIVNPFTKLGLSEPKEPIAYDVQFFPEGGDLISDVDTKIGVRVTDRFGKGVGYAGAIVDEQRDTVVRFGPLKFGLGSFNLTAKKAHTYTAAIRVGNGKYKSYPLPSIQPEGYSLHVLDTAGRIAIRITAPDESMTLPYCYLFVHTRGTHVMSKLVYFKNGVAHETIDPSSLGEGISNISILTSSMRPVCERLYFKRPTSMAISASPDQNSYSRRKKVNVGFSAGNNIPTGMSVAVFKYDSLTPSDDSDIRSWFWLTSSLRGPIEMPGYYFTDEAQGKATDNLMLTHGWSHYRWEDVLAPTPRQFQFIPEFRGHIVSGKVTGSDLGNGKKITAYLSNPDKNIRLYPSRSSVDGMLRFELRDFFGPRKLIAQTNTRLDSIYDLEILTPFAQNFSKTVLPEFDLPKNLAGLVAQRSLYMQVQNTFHEPKSDRFFVPSLDTTAFYGVPDERYYLDDYTRFPTMEEVMREYVPGVRVRKRKSHFYFMNMDTRRTSMFKDNPLVLLDGVPVFDIDKIIAMDPLKVKKLEVMTRKYFLGPLSFDGIVSYTTYTGDLSDIEIDRRALVVDYEGLQVYREFFSPQYETENQLHDRTPDVRNLVYWKPVVATDASGKAAIDFYTPDTVGKYKIVIQGIDANGRPGVGNAFFDVIK